MSAADRCFEQHLYSIGKGALTKVLVSEASSRIDDFELLEHCEAFPPQFDVAGSMLFEK